MLTRRKVRRAAMYAGVALGAISLLALIASAVRPMGVPFSAGARSIVLARGSINVYWNPGLITPFTSYSNGDPGFRPGWWRWLPKLVEPEPRTPQVGAFVAGFGRMGEFILPLWIPSALGLLCVYYLLPERGPRHLCEKCNYDLRAVPAAGGRTTCPECGTIADA